MLGDAFKHHGVPVYYSYEADNDDTLAAYSHRDNAAILSQDQDFHRYKDTEFTVFSHYTIRKGDISLSLNVKNPKRMKEISKRPIISPPPLTITHSPELSDLEKGFFRTGPATPLLKIKESPQLTLRPIRLALYCTLGIQSPITEIIPRWNNQLETVEWSNDTVHPDPKYSSYLNNPENILKEFMSESQLVKPTEVPDETWRLHMFSCLASVFSLTALASRGNQSLLSLLLPVAEDYLARNSQPVVYAHTFRCVKCKTTAGLTESEVKWYSSKEFSLPKRCKSCR